MRLFVYAALLFLLGAIPTASAVDPPDVGPATPGHVDIFLPQLQGCLWTGSYKVLVEVGPVTVWHFTCDPET